MELKIYRDSNFTIHIQLKEQLKGLILNNILENGMQLPTVRQLGEFLRINKNTVSKVYKELEVEGYVYSVKGRGTFVSNTDKPQKTREFLKVVDSMLNMGIKNSISLEEIWGIVYSRSQHYKVLQGDIKKRKFAFIECNDISTKDFEKMLKLELPDVEMDGILIEDLQNNYEKVKKEVEDIQLIVIPYIHYEEVKKELKNLGKEVIIIGTNQTLKILTSSKKIKNKIVGVIGFSADDEIAISRQFNKIDVKEFNYYGGLDEVGEDKLRPFLRKVDSLIICSSIIEDIVNKLKPKKPYVLFEGKYDKNDFKPLVEIFSHKK
ncbi:GntR family transcriptional regulator [Haliovirga abyssi]|uniref:HTH gntR-type domain-containing protein n=1 Tax=Haliovirga abyssi TaxID=2996794 RepID=A0AAU9D0L6_9FUSO|nr:GntR family transcriptional regulator [Haliovirga abyssi]BDU49504.1 hypothetical protein HLVA_00730 [Haliovirga abyssi]